MPYVETTEFQQKEVERRLLKAKLAGLAKVAGIVGGLTAPLLVVAQDYLETRAMAHTHSPAAVEAAPEKDLCSWWELGCED